MNIGYPFFGGSYRARCIRVVDGDTVDLVVDLGFHCSLTGRFRLLGIDTPELHAADPTLRARAVEAKAHLLASIGETWDGTTWALRLTDVRHDPDNFGRWLAVLWKHDDAAVEQNVNQDLISAGLAVPYRV